MNNEPPAYIIFEFLCDGKLSIKLERTYFSTVLRNEYGVKKQAISYILKQKDKVIAAYEKDAQSIAIH